MTKAIDFINFIKVNKLEDVAFATGYDDNLCLTFQIKLDDDRTIDYEFAHTGKQETRIRLFTYKEIDDCDLETKELTSEEALKLRGLV